jgi:hypothetical protein
MTDAPAAPAASIAESASVYLLDATAGKAASDATLPLGEVVPPPDDEDDVAYEAPEEDTPTPPDPAAVAENQPALPPVVEMPERTTSVNDAVDERVPMDGEEGGRPPVTESPSTYRNGAGMSDGIAAEVVEDTPNLNGLSRVLIVEIRASGNWKEACRQTLKLAGRYEGNAMLRLQLAGQDLVMDFPNHRVGCQVELIEALERLAGVGRVYER